MGLYDLAVADGHQHERRAQLLPVLGAIDTGRYRDCWVEKDDDGALIIAVYTRNGGGNREAYADVIAAMRAHPLYIRDADDGFDSTYATFYFQVPPEQREALASDAVDHVDTDDRWKQAIERVQRGDISPALRATGDQIAAALMDDGNDGPKVIRI